MSDEVARPIPSIEIPDTPDVFLGCRELIRLFHGIADYLSLWCSLYGLREDHLRASKVAWRDAHMMLFRITDRHGRAVSPTRYDPRLPEVEHVFLARAWRIRNFIATQAWFREKIREVDAMHRAYLRRWEYTPEDVEIVNRWTDGGVIIVSYVWKHTTPTPRRYMTHLRYSDRQA